MQFIELSNSDITQGIEESGQYQFRINNNFENSESDEYESK